MIGQHHGRIERDDRPVSPSVDIGEPSAHVLGQLADSGEEPQVARLGRQLAESLVEVPLEVARNRFTRDDCGQVFDPSMMPEWDTPRAATPVTINSDA
jgi:hypothetical protein